MNDPTIEGTKTNLTDRDETGIVRKIVGALLLVIFLVFSIVSVILIGVSQTVLDADHVLEWIGADLFSTDLVNNFASITFIPHKFESSPEGLLKGPLVEAYTSLESESSFLQTLLPTENLLDFLESPIRQVFAAAKNDGDLKSLDIDLQRLSDIVVAREEAAGQDFFDSLPICSPQQEIELTEYFSPIEPSFDREISFHIYRLDIWRIDVNNPNAFTDFRVDEIGLSYYGDQQAVIQSGEEKPDCNTFVDLVIPAGEQKHCFLQIRSDRREVFDDVFSLTMSTEYSEETPEFSFCQSSENEEAMLSVIQDALASELSSSTTNIPTSFALDEFVPYLSMFNTVKNMPIYATAISLVALVVGSWLIGGKSSLFFPAGISLAVAAVIGWLLTSTILPDYILSRVSVPLRTALDMFEESVITGVQGSVMRLLDSAWNATTVFWIGMLLCGAILIAVNRRQSSK